MALIKIVTTDGIKDIEAEFQFDAARLPYGLYGYKFNGSGNNSMVAKENMKKYWTFIDYHMQKFPYHEYVTLLSIKDYGRDAFHGIPDEAIQDVRYYYENWIKFKHNL